MEIGREMTTLLSIAHLEHDQIGTTVMMLLQQTRDTISMEQRIWAWKMVNHSRDYTLMMLMFLAAKREGQPVQTMITFLPCHQACPVDVR
jgi:hypothetical protein